MELVISKLEHVCAREDSMVMHVPTSVTTG